MGPDNIRYPTATFILYLNPCGTERGLLASLITIMLKMLHNLRCIFQVYRSLRAAVAGNFFTPFHVLSFCVLSINPVGV